MASVEWVEPMRMMIAMVLVGGLACGPTEGDEESTGDGGGDASSGEMDASATSEGEASTTEGSSSGEVDGSTSDSSESGSESSAGASPCDADCESLDESTCGECPDCTTLWASPWDTDPQGGPCLGASVYIGCQTGTCLSQTTTWCNDGGAMFEIDFICADDFSPYQPCETPDDTYPNCP